MSVLGCSTAPPYGVPYAVVELSAYAGPANSPSSDPDGDSDTDNTVSPAGTFTVSDAAGDVLTPGAAICQTNQCGQIEIGYVAGAGPNSTTDCNYQSNNTPYTSDTVPACSSMVPEKLPYDVVAAQDPLGFATATSAAYRYPSDSTSGSSSSTTGTATASIGDLSASASGQGTLGLATYHGNPVGPPNFDAAGQFFAASPSHGNSFTSLTIDQCGISNGDTLQWWDPGAASGMGAWRPISDQTSSGSCAATTLGATTSPNLTQLGATVFAVAGPSVPSAYTPLPPERICDTRAGNPSSLTGPAAQCNGRTLAASSPLSIQATGIGGVPTAGVSAVALKVTVARPKQSGYLTVYPAGKPPMSSNIDFARGTTVPNEVVVPVSSTGTITLVSDVSTDVLVDMNGYYSTGTQGTQFHAALAPTRICDTRFGALDNPCTGHTLGPNGTLSLQVAGLSPMVPSGATAVVLNVTVTAPTNPGYLTVWPGGPQPVISDLNWTARATIANLVVATLSPTGSIDIYNSAGSTGVVVDVLGWYQ